MVYDDESDVSLTEEIDSFEAADLQTGDYTLCKFSTEKGRTIMYAGVVTDVGDEYEVKFLRKSGFGGFIFPDVPDICDVAKSDVVLKIPCPLSSGGTSRAGRHLSFPVDLAAYKQYLC